MEFNFKKAIFSGILAQLFTQIVFSFIEYGLLILLVFNASPLLVSKGVIYLIIVGTIYGIVYSVLYNNLKMEYYKKGIIFGLILWLIVSLVPMVGLYLREPYYLVNTYPVLLGAQILLKDLLGLLLLGFVLSYLYEKSSKWGLK